MRGCSAVVQVLNFLCRWLSPFSHVPLDLSVPVLLAPWNPGPPCPFLHFLPVVSSQLPPSHASYAQVPVDVLAPLLAVSVALLPSAVGQLLVAFVRSLVLGEPLPSSCGAPRLSSPPPLVEQLPQQPSQPPSSAALPLSVASGVAVSLSCVPSPWPSSNFFPPLSGLPPRSPPAVSAVVRGRPFLDMQPGHVAQTCALR